MWTDDDRPSHSPEACAQLIDRFLVEPDELLRVIAPEGAHSPEAKRELVELFGRALWDVFSQNHTVVDSEGTTYDLGSLRGSAAFIADAVDRAYPHIDDAHGYLDFYMGTTPGEERADLRAVYRWIFAGLKDAGCRWTWWTSADDCRTMMS
jgi:hypothetical protein